MKLKVRQDPDDVEHEALVEDILADAALSAKLLQVFASCSTEAQINMAFSYFQRMQKQHPQLNYAEVTLNLGKLEVQRLKLNPILPRWMRRALPSMPMRVQDIFWREIQQFYYRRCDWATPRVPLNDHGLYIPGTGY
jgi:hypothetical protein